MDKKRLFNDLKGNYEETHKKSKEYFVKARQFQIGGGSHNLRLFSPFPFYDIHCEGSKVTDIDGNTYIDFWQGHFANILGHNPKIVLDALQDYFEHGQGLATGFPGSFQRELAELILTRIDQDKIRFTTSGTLSTMYAIMLARSFSRRELVLKVGGGWHGAQPFALKGISSFKDGLSQIESAGLYPEVDSTIVITKYNDVEDLEEKFRDYGERIACMIVEPFIGAGGFIFAHKDYIQKARELTSQYDAILIFDEVVSGFRFHAAGVQSLYNVKPDLSVFGKSIGGGMPVSAVAGRDVIMNLCDAEVTPDRKVKFEGGTFSAHPASMLAGIAYIKYLIDNESEVYPRMGRLGAQARSEIEKIFSSYGIRVSCTGSDDTITKNSSVVGVHFLIDEKVSCITSPEQALNPEIVDFELREKIFKLSMLEEGFNVFNGYGTISAAHTEEEIQSSLDAIEKIAQKWAKYK